MKTSEKAKEGIRAFEGLRLQTYQDAGGTCTIGYGHTQNVTARMTIDKQEALELFEQDVEQAEGYVEKLGLRLTQGQFDCLVDFTFNLGIARLANSNLLRFIRSNAPDTSICTELMKWSYCNGKVLPGLWRRRHWDCELWKSTEKQ